jgi:signal transduction histidine kinase
MDDNTTSQTQISDLQQLVDELRATVELKDHLLQMVSHEMRTPLVSITNFSSSILGAWDVLPDEDKREYLTIINNQSTRLSRLVSDLLAVARLESGRLRTVREQVDIAEVARETIRELRPEVEVEVRCDHDLSVTADRDHVKQILVNFLSNAL